MKRLTRFAANIFAPLAFSFREIRDLLSPFEHAPEVKDQRAKLVISRVQLISALFVVLVVAWSVIDYFFFPWPEWAQLVVLRLATSSLFVVLAWPRMPVHLKFSAGMMLVAMLAIPLGFSVIAQPVLTGLHDKLDGRLGPRVLLELYSLLPFVIVAGLSIFPLTALEVLVLSAPIMIINGYQQYHGAATQWDEYIGELWLMALIIGVSTFSGMSQLHYLIALVNQASQDALTMVYNRRAGGEFLARRFHRSMSRRLPLSLAFLDIDRFKAINDRYGHEAGDAVLRQFTAVLQAQLRGGERLIRWGGEEFLLVFQDVTKAEAQARLEALREQGFGERPDGDRLTASVGLAERGQDDVDDWRALVEVADQRMYSAKITGRDRIICESLIQE